MRKFTGKLSLRWQSVINIAFWLVPIVNIIWLVYLALNTSREPGSNLQAVVQYFIGYVFLFYVPKLLYMIIHVFQDILHGLAWITKKLSPEKSIAADTAQKISRSQFINKMGIIAAGIPFIAIGNGILHGRFDFTVRRHILKFTNLPPAFDGLKIVQFSDFHIGSFTGLQSQVEKAIDKINMQNSDLLLFTGDFVNNISQEMDEFLQTLQKLSASKYGKYSILGNHDYGEYVHWPSESDKKENLNRLIGLHKDLGFTPLLNESIRLKKDEQEIALIGVENWGLPPFPQYGDLDKASQNTADLPFKILMTHDPTHWDEKVLGKTNIDLTLSGHTHGMQFGIEIPGWRWSPVNLRYKHWGGLYSEAGQYLYVNTGIGYIGFPGRVGMPPEITVFELQCS